MMSDYNARWGSKTLSIIYFIAAVFICLLFIVLELLQISSLATTIALILALSAIGLGLILMRQNRYELSVIIFGTVVWTCISGVVIVRGGLRLPAVVLYPLVILLMGIYARPIWAIISGLASILILSAIMIAQTNGFLAEPAFEITPLQTLIFNSITISVSAVIVYFTSIAVLRNQSALQESQQQEADRRQAIEEQANQLRQANQALEINKDRFRSLLNNAGDQILLLDSNGFIIDVNQQATIDLGYREDELIGMNVTQVDIAWDKERFAQQLQEMPYDLSITLSGLERRKDGSTFPVEVRARKTKVGDETVIIGLIRDITERLETEENLRQSQKLQSLGLLAGGVAHDFNNLLVALLGQTSMARHKLEANHPARLHVEKAVQAAKQAAEITKQLLAFSGRGHFQKVILDVNELIEQNLALFQVGIPKRISLRSDLSEDLPPIEADTGQVQQVIMNLILNAAEAIGDRPGTIRVLTGTQELTTKDLQYHQLTATPLTPGNYVTIEVSDDGPGIEPHVLDKVFDPFFTTKTTGHGLGLAAVLGIMRGHKGGLIVYSEMEKGTTFKLFLPAASGEVTSLLIPPLEKPASPLPSKTIMIIDDDNSVRQTVREILEISEYQVIEAADGYTAIELFESAPEAIDLIILDMTMPGLSGEETYQQIRQIKGNARIILSSGYNHIEATRRIKGRPYVAFLQKPYTFNQLLETIDKHLQSPA